MVIKLNAQWIVGFVDAEGCFGVFVRHAADGQTPIGLEPAFVVTQHKRDVQILYALKAYFGCGSVYEPNPTQKEDHVAYWKVRKLEHLLSEVIPFFEKHRLKTQKGIAFRRFRRICLLMREKVHRTPEGLAKCVNLARNLRVPPQTQAGASMALDDPPEIV